MPIILGYAVVVIPTTAHNRKMGVARLKICKMVNR